MRNFEAFKGRYRPANKTLPRATIRRDGRLGFNQATYLLLGSPTHVVFYFEKEAKTIALRSSEGSELYAFPVACHPQYPSYYISCRLFLRDIGIKYRKGPFIFKPTIEQGLDGELVVLEAI